jgi:DNA-binding transcriptional LysR family regulator
LACQYQRNNRDHRFTAAARQLNYSQSAVSMQLRRLEDELGINVLKRNTQTPEPTWVGREVLGYAREMLRLDRELRERLADQKVAGTVAACRSDCKSRV